MYIYKIRIKGMRKEMGRRDEKDHGFASAQCEKFRNQRKQYATTLEKNKMERKSDESKGVIETMGNDNVKSLNRIQKRIAKLEEYIYP